MTDIERFLDSDISRDCFSVSTIILSMKKYLLGVDTKEFVIFGTSVYYNYKAYKNLKDNKLTLPALTFVRILAESLVYLYAEYLYPEKVLEKIYINHKELCDVKIKGEKIKPADIRVKVIESYPDFERIWKKYHYFIHPSYLQTKFGNAKEEGAIGEEGLKDITNLTIWILEVLNKIKDRYKKAITDKGKWEEYKDWLITTDKL